MRVLSVGSSSFWLLALLALLGCASDSEPDPVSCHPVTVGATDPEAIAHAPDSSEVAVARAVADRYIAEHTAESHAYDWGEGVLMAATLACTRPSRVRKADASPGLRDQESLDGAC